MRTAIKCHHFCLALHTGDIWWSI